MLEANKRGNKKETLVYDLGPRLKDLSKELNRSVWELGKEAGFHRSTVHTWLSGQSGLTLDSVAKLAPYYHKTPEELIEGIDPRIKGKSRVPGQRKRSRTERRSENSKTPEHEPLNIFQQKDQAEPAGSQNFPEDEEKIPKIAETDVLADIPADTVDQQVESRVSAGERADVRVGEDGSDVKIAKKVAELPSIDQSDSVIEAIKWDRTLDRKARIIEDSIRDEWIPPGWESRESRLRDINFSMHDGYYIDPRKVDKLGPKRFLLERLCADDKKIVADKNVSGTVLVERIYTHCRNLNEFMPEIPMPIFERMLRLVLASDTGGLTDSELVEMLGERSKDKLPVSSMLLKRLRTLVGPTPVTRVDAFMIADHWKTI